ncbi:hypothetical protein HOLleu_31600 [Holothuria leucospilota]|uniref:BEN domain-containing protein n=1 Tax=Holothuria leucospilota TaxID=206669 RepID=A0A9Q1BGD6_HOLLE|nr:hypothetical protein HOLleu_31600 [Holothuria leucospilota]
MESIRPLKKRRFTPEEDTLDIEKLFLKALAFQQDMVEVCRKILTEVIEIMLDVDTKGREIQMYLNRTENTKVPVKKRSTSQEPCGWLHPSKREELHKLSAELSGTINDCNIKLEHLRSSVASLSKNMTFLKSFFGIAENREKTEMDCDNLKHLEEREDRPDLPWITPAVENSLINEAVAGILADLSNKMKKLEDDLNTLTKKTVTVESEVRRTMTVIRGSINENCNTEPHRQISDTSAAVVADTECSLSSRCLPTDDTEKPSACRLNKSISKSPPDFLNVGNKAVTITIQRKRKEISVEKQQLHATETENRSTHVDAEPKPIIIEREIYDKMKRNSSTAFARKLLTYFFHKHELELYNFSTLPDREKVDTLLEIVEYEFPESTVGAEAMKKIRDGINSSCRAHKDKLKLSNLGQQSVTA